MLLKKTNKLNPKHHFCWSISLCVQAKQADSHSMPKVKGRLFHPSLYTPLWVPTLLPPVPPNTTIKGCTWGKDRLTACLLTIPMAVTYRCFNSVLSIKGRHVFPQQPIYFDILVVTRQKNMSACFVCVMQEFFFLFIYAKVWCSFTEHLHIPAVLYSRSVLYFCWLLSVNSST